MNPPNFVNYHILISHSPSCLNRDDMNMQKTAVFGGVKRVRISSQSLKRAMRKSAYYAANLGASSIRSRDLERLKDEFISELGEEFSEEVISRTVDLFAKAKASDEAPDDSDESSGVSESGEKKTAVAPWVKAEIRELCKIVSETSLTDEERTAAVEKFKKQKGKKPKSEQTFIDDALIRKIAKLAKDDADTIRRATGEALDIALSGRMATSGLMTSIDGAMAVAHAITTHAVEQDVDWFTAVDDLVVDAGEVGAGHLNTQEFSAGVFYRYASLNLGQLQANLGGASRERALEIAAHLLHLLTTVVPSAKQQSFAAHNPADFALVSFADQPISLANAFEEPVSGKKGLLEPSLAKLAGYWQTVNSRYGLAENAAAFSLRETALPQTLKAQSSLPALEAWVRGGGAE